MSTVAAVAFLDQYGRYKYASTMSNTIKDVVFFGELVGFKDRASNVFNTLQVSLTFDFDKEPKPGIDILLEKYNFGNTPETAIDPSLLSNLNSQTFEMPMGCNALFVNCPDETTYGWLLIDGVFLDQEAYVNWRDNLMEKGFPPRSPEELAEDKRIAEEDRRLANLRPKKMGKIAIARVRDLDNYCVALIELDVNNTTVKDIRRLITKANGVEAGERPLASTNYFTAQGLKDLADKYKGNYSMTVTIRHQLASVVMNKGYGQPKVRVPSDTRSTLADNVRLADMKGEVIVYFYNGIPSTPFSWKDFLIGELFAALLGESGNYL